MPPGLKLKFCIFPTQRIYMFRIIFIVNNDYFHKQY